MTLGSMTFDAHDARLREKGIGIWNNVIGPRVGDYVDFADGRQTRISVISGKQLQINAPEFGSSFHFLWWYCSYSGGHGASLKLVDLIDTQTLRDGQVWFFHHDQSGPHRGVNCKIPCRIYNIKNDGAAQ